MDLKEKKILYHGTGQEHLEIDLSCGKDYKDFGRGYYLTSNFMQAYSWATKKAIDNVCWIYEYEVETIPHALTVLELLEYNVQWLDFITANRIHGIHSSYDIIYDRMADNGYSVLSTLIRKYDEHTAESQYVLKEIAFKNKKKDQFCFKTKAAISVLKRINSTKYIRKDGTNDFIICEE